MEHAVFNPAASPAGRGYVRTHGRVPSSFSSEGKQSALPTLDPRLQWQIDAKERLAGFLLRIQMMQQDEEVRFAELCKGSRPGRHTSTFALD